MFHPLNADDISLKLLDNEAALSVMNEIAEYYKPVACRGSLIFLLMIDLRRLKSYYQFSFTTFFDLYTLGVTVEADAYRERSTMGELSLPPINSTTSSIKKDTSQSMTLPSNIKHSPIFHKTDKKIINNDTEKDKKDCTYTDCTDITAADIKDLMCTESYDLLLETLCAEIMKRAENIRKFPDDKKFNIRSRIIFLKKNVTAVLYDYLRIGISERDEETVGTLLSLRILQIEGHINQVSRI